MQTTQQYNNVSRLLHWLTAFLVAAMFLTVWVAEEMPEHIEHLLVDMHKVFGFLVLLLTALRIVWRLVSPRIEPAKGSRKQQVAAHAVHGFLYMLLLAVPLAGWAFVSAKGRAISFFGFFDVPALFEKNDALGRTLFETHEVLANGLLFFVAAHIAAAVYHQFFVKDNLINRMLP